MRAFPAFVGKVKKRATENETNKTYRKFGGHILEGETWGVQATAFCGDDIRIVSQIKKE